MKINRDKKDIENFIKNDLELNPVEILEISDVGFGLIFDLVSTTILFTHYIKAIEEFTGALTSCISFEKLPLPKYFVFFSFE